MILCLCHLFAVPGFPPRVEASWWIIYLRMRESPHLFSKQQMWVQVSLLSVGHPDIVPLYTSLAGAYVPTASAKATSTFPPAGTVTRQTVPVLRSGSVLQRVPQRLVFQGRAPCKGRWKLTFSRRCSLGLKLWSKWLLWHKGSTSGMRTRARK